jgi:hypothetical protein
MFSRGGSTLKFLMRKKLKKVREHRLKVRRVIRK